MKIYGRINQESERPAELVEVTLMADPSKLREIAGFLNSCAQKMEDKGDSWEHEHFQSKDEIESIGPEFIVFNLEAL